MTDGALQGKALAAVIQFDGNRTPMQRPKGYFAVGINNPRGFIERGDWKEIRAQGSCDS